MLHVITLSPTACLMKGIKISIRPISTFAQLSFTYVAAMVASNKALAYITYPTQVDLAVLDCYCYN